MENKDTNGKIMAALEAFDAIENIQTTDNWNATLMAKIANTKIKTPITPFSAKFATMITCLVLINVGFVTATIFSNDDNQAPTRDKTLKTLSKELLFNVNN